MTKSISRSKLAIVSILLATTVMSGCVYFNTFYNARKAFNEAEGTRTASKTAGGRINANQYQIAIEKSLKVIENHPNSSYYDDALYVLGVSYYWTRSYIKSERRLRELLANHQESKYVNDARLYLAKAKLEQNDMDDAMELFQEIFTGDYKNDLKAEAAVALGEYHFKNNEHDVARQYFLATRDSLGTKEEQKWAQIQIADGYFETFKFDEALGAYLQVLGMEPTLMEEYHALYRAAMCSYRLQNFDVGRDYLNTLAEDQRFFDSLGTIKLELAYGYLAEGNLVEAERIYHEVAEEDPNRFKAGEAYYQLGLMYQFDYDELEQAKRYYDKTAELAKGTESANDALQRSSDIGKLETYSVDLVVDSTTTQAAIDEAAYTQFQLAELYWLKLDKPDTAILEMQVVVDSFPSAYDAPAALIALSEMYRKRHEDDEAADSILNLVLENYPRSDYVEDALEALGLKGSEADTGYAGVYIDKAEDFLIDEKNVDSAQYYYQYVVDNFPDSKHYLKAKFALIWTLDQYDPPGDSSIYFAYQEFADSFPNTEWAGVARAQFASGPRQQPFAQQQDTAGQFAAADDTSTIQGGGQFTYDDRTNQDDTGYVDPLKNLYIDPNGDTAVDLSNNAKILDQREEFEYPIEAYSTDWEGYLYFQLFLDFSGQVSDLVLKTHSPSEILDQEAIRAVSSMTFDIQDIPLQFQGKWFVYKYEVRKPDHLR